MRGKRKYYKKLARVFLIIATAIFTIITLSALAIANYSIESRNNALSSAVYSQIQQTTSIMGFISNTINSLSTSNEVLLWAETVPSTPEYYYTSIQLFEQIRKNSPLLEYLNYDIAVTTDNPESFVVTGTGTQSKHIFASSFPDVPETLAEGIYPVYGADSLLSAMLLITGRQTDSGRLLFLITIPASALHTDNSNIKLEITDRIRGISFPDMEETGNSTVRETASFPALGFSAAYSYQDTSAMLIIILLLLLIPALIAVLMFIFSRTAHSLYRPVDEALTSLDVKTEEQVDEFKLITDNCQRISSLSQELSKAVEARQQLAEQQKYRSFLRGVPTAIKDDDSSAYFALALAVRSQEDDNPDLSFARMEVIAAEIPHVHSIRSASDECVFIVKNPDGDAADRILRETIGKITSEASEDSTIRFAVISASLGYNSIEKAYRKARELSEYRFRIKNRIILTEADIQDSCMLMDYPITEERKLINAVLASSDEALSIFDRIIEANTGTSRVLSPPELKRFCFALTGTLLRIFQELKTSPEELLGRSIDYDGLYSKELPDELVSTLRATIGEIIGIKQKQDEEEDDLVVSRMKKYISQHYMENLMLIDLSNEFNLTPKYCSSIFRKLGNDTFRNYLNEYRIKEACRILGQEPDIRIAELAGRVGFTSANTFIRVFGKYTGVTPGAYADKISGRS